MEHKSQTYKLEKQTQSLNRFAFDSRFIHGINYKGFKQWVNDTYAQRLKSYGIKLRFTQTVSVPINKELL